MSAKRERQSYQITLYTNSIKLTCTPPCVRSTCKPTVTDQLVHKLVTKPYHFSIYTNSIRSTCPPLVSDQLVNHAVSDQLVYQPYQPNLYTNSIRSAYTPTVSDLLPRATFCCWRDFRNNITKSNNKKVSGGKMNRQSSGQLYKGISSRIQSLWG